MFVIWAQFGFSEDDIERNRSNVNTADELFCWPKVTPTNLFNHLEHNPITEYEERTGTSTKRTVANTSIYKCVISCMLFYLW